MGIIEEVAFHVGVEPGEGDVVELVDDPLAHVGVLDFEPRILEVGGDVGLIADE